VFQEFRSPWPGAGRLSWEEGFGYADLGRMRPMRAETSFAPARWARRTPPPPSCSWWSKNLVALDEPINTYLRRGAGFEVKNPLGTVRSPFATPDPSRRHHQ